MPRLRTALVAALLALPAHAVPSDATAQQPTQVRVMSYNIHHGAAEDGRLDLSAIAGVIRTYGADIVGLQEVDRHWSERSAFADQASELATQLGMHYFFAPIYDLPPADGNRPRREYGLAILSRFPILEAANHTLTRLPTLPGDTVPRRMPGFPGVLLNIGGAPLHFFNTHLDYRADPSTRAVQVRETVEILKGVDGPIVLVGDLNARPGSAELLPLAEILRDTWEVAGVGDGFTFPASHPDRRIDYILATPDVEVAAVRVPGTIASDHRPVVADLLIPGRPSAATPFQDEAEVRVEAELACPSCEQLPSRPFFVRASPFRRAHEPGLNYHGQLDRQSGGLLCGSGNPLSRTALDSDRRALDSNPRRSCDGDGTVFQPANRE